MKLDSEDGTWIPSEFGMADERTFPRHARGELVVAKSYEVSSEQTGSVQLRIDDAEILGRVTRDRKSHSDDIFIRGCGPYRQRSISRRTAPTTRSSTPGRKGPWMPK